MSSEYDDYVKVRTVREIERPSFTLEAGTVISVNLANANANDEWLLAEWEDYQFSVHRDDLPPKLKGLRVNVYRWDLGDCSNNGISSSCKDLTLIGYDPINGGTIDPVFESKEDAPAVCIRDAGNVWHLRPANPYTGEPLDGWFMSGGNLAYSSDSRFPFDYALKIHDRREW